MCVECYRKEKDVLTHLIFKLKKMNKEEMLNTIHPHRKELIDGGFTTNFEMGGIQFDDNSKRLHIPIQDSDQNGVRTVFDYSQIIDVEIVEDGETITKGTLGGVLMGDMIAGTAGAIIGSNIGKKKSKNLIVDIITEFFHYFTN